MKDQNSTQRRTLHKHRSYSLCCAEHMSSVLNVFLLDWESFVMCRLQVGAHCFSQVICRWCPRGQAYDRFLYAPYFHHHVHALYYCSQLMATLCNATCHVLFVVVFFVVDVFSLNCMFAHVLGRIWLMQFLTRTN